MVGLSPDEIAAAIHGLPGGDRRFRGQQLFRWLHARHAASFAAMTDLPLALREALAIRFRAGELELRRRVASATSDTEKLILATAAGDEIETVRIATERRVTLCLSTQVGCALGCRFCRTAAMGLLRNLRAGEIVDQILHIQRTRPLPNTYNIVFMGMGEPLANFDEMARAVGLIGRQEGLAIGPRRITVSTAGVVPGIERLSRELPRVRLAVSLGATTDHLRSELMPIGKRYPLARLLRAVRDHVRATRQRVTFEYVMLAGVNDGLADARRLVRIAAQMPCKINLIPYNSIGSGPFRGSAPAVIKRFAEYLYPRTYAVTVRSSRGDDILAACGQLARIPATGAGAEAANPHPRKEAHLAMLTA